MEEEVIQRKRDIKKNDTVEMSNNEREMMKVKTVRVREGGGCKNKWKGETTYITDILNIKNSPQNTSIHYCTCY